MVWHGDICDKLVFSQKERNMQRWDKESEDVGSRTIQYFLTPDPSLDPFKWEYYGLSCLPHKAFMLINGKVTYNRRVLLPCWSLRHFALETYVMRYFNSSWWICLVFHYSRFNDLLLGEIHSKRKYSSPGHHSELPVKLEFPEGQGLCLIHSCE